MIWLKLYFLLTTKMRLVETTQIFYYENSIEVPLGFEPKQINTEKGLDHRGGLFRIHVSS
jgi:hypothetical protein